MRLQWLLTGRHRTGAAGIVIGITAATLAVPAAAATGATISGTVWQDYDANGVRSSVEEGLAGVTVRAVADGVGADVTATTEPDGSYTLTVPTDDARWRVEATLPEHATWARFQPSVVGANNGSTVQHVSVATANATGVDFSFQVPGTVTDPNTDVYVPTLQYGTYDGANAGAPGGTTFKWEAVSGQVVPQTVQPLWSEVGATNGATSVRGDIPGAPVTVLAAAYMRRHAGFGELGIGGIYRITPAEGTDWATGNSADVQHYVNLADPTFQISLGGPPSTGTPSENELRPIRQSENSGYNWSRDAVAYNLVGRSGLGLISMDATEQYLYAVNLNTSTLIQIDTEGDLSDPVDAKDVTEFSFPDTFADPDLRPYGVSVDPVTGTMYLTATYTAETAFKNAQTEEERQAARDMLKGYVYSFQPGALRQQSVTDADDALTPELEFALNYSRGPSGEERQAFQPWQTSIVPGRGSIEYWPEPVVSAVQILHGDMIIGVRDRTGDMFGGYTFYSPDPANATRISERSKGDVLIAGRNATGTWVLESGGSVPGHDQPGAGGTQWGGPGGGQYFDTQFASDGHEALGAIITNPASETGLMSTGLHSAGGEGQEGVRRFTVDTGEHTAGAQLRSSGGYESVTYKGNGLGSITTLAAAAPIEIGNYVWYDTGGPLADWTPTVPETGDPGSADPTRNDSDGVVDPDTNFPQTVTTTGGPGMNDHSIDFGFSNARVTFHKSLVAGPTASSTEDGTWAMEYRLEVTNPALSPTTYALSDDLTGFGAGITVTDAEVTGSTPTGLPINPSWDGDTDQQVTTSTEVPILGGATHQYTLRVVVALVTDPVTGALVAPDSLACTADQQPGPGSTGLFNVARVTPAGGEPIAGTVCADLPVVTVHKTVVAPGPAPVDPVNLPGVYQVSYQVVVSNESTVATDYTLADTFRFGPGVTVTGAPEVSAAQPALDPDSDPALNTNFDGERNETIIEDRPIQAGAEHSYTVGVQYTAELPRDIPDPDTSGCPTDPGASRDTGLLNQATVTMNGYPAQSTACAGLGDVTHEKTLVSAEPVGNGQWQVQYQITVHSVGVEPSSYTLLDELHFGTGITVADAAVTGPEGVTVNEAWDGTDDLVLASEVPILGSDDTGYQPHRYLVTVRANVPMQFPIPDSGVDPASCGPEDTDGRPVQDRAFLNVSTLRDSAGAREDDDACAPVPQFRLDKTVVDGSPVQQDDGSWLVRYQIEVQNTSDVAGEYQLDDQFQFADQITVTDARVTEVPQGITADPGWTGVGEHTLITSAVPLPAGTMHVYQVQVQVTVDDPNNADLVEQAFACADPGPRNEHGLTNEATVHHNDLAVTDQVCANLPTPEPTPPTPEPTPRPLPPAVLPITGAQLAGTGVLAGVAGLLAVLGIALLIRRTRTRSHHVSAHDESGAG